MITEATQILRDLDGKTDLTVRRGVFAGVSGMSGLVDMGDSRFVCAFGTGYIPVVAETVMVWSVAGQHFLFPAGPRPTVGTVITVSESTALVQTSVGDYTMPYVGGTPASGDRVGVVWSEDGPWCAGKQSTTPAPPAPVPDPGGNTIRSATFKAIDAGSSDRSQARWWQAQPWASNTTFGAWFYGTQIKDTIPASASFVSLEFYSSWQSKFGGDPRFVLHDAATKGALPGYSGYVQWAPGSGWQTPPGAGDWFNALKAGGAWRGIGLNQGGFNKFSSLAQDSMSGALRISWRS